MTVTCPFCDEPAKLVPYTIRYRRGDKVLPVQVQQYQCPGSCVGPEGDGVFTFADLPLMRINQKKAEHEWRARWGEDMPPSHRKSKPQTVDKPPITWTVKEYIGPEIYEAPPGLTYEEVLKSEWPEGFKTQPITKRDAIQEGSIVLIPSIFGGMGVYRVEQNTDGSFHGMSSGTIACLQFDTDDRHCWTCCGIGNLAALKKLKLQK